MNDDLERRAARHESASLWDGAPPYCVACSFEEGESLPDDVPWPCLVHELATALTAEQAQLAAAQARIATLEPVAAVARRWIDQFDRGVDFPHLRQMMRDTLAALDCATTGAQDG